MYVFCVWENASSKYAYVRAQKCLVFVLGDKHTFMQIFALALFNVFGLAMLYQTAIFLVFLAVW